GLRPGGSGESRLSRQDGAQRGNVRRPGARVRLPLVRHPLVPQLRLRPAGAGGGGPRPRARADTRARADARTARRRGRAQPVLGTGEALPGARGHRRPRRPRARRAAVRALRARVDAAHRHRPAHRHHEGNRALVALRPRGLAVSQPAVPTLSRTTIPGDAATPALGSCSITRPGFPCTTRTAAFSLSRRSFSCAFATSSPTMRGTVPCRGFASTSVT